MGDWYRQKNWTKTEEDYFFTKLGRARMDSRAQYLKIQAIELVATHDKNLINVAEQLIDKLFLEYPDDKFNRPGALMTLGNIYTIRENFNKAIGYYKQAIDFELVYPQQKTQAYLCYSELVIKTQMIDFFDAVENILLEKLPHVLFPVERYKGYSILSIINTHKGNKELADHFSVLAETNANKETSGLSYHKYLGVVTKRDSWLDKLVKG